MNLYYEIHIANNVTFFAVMFGKDLISYLVYTVYFCIWSFPVVCPSVCFCVA